MVKLFANSGDPDQMPHSAASDLGLHCLPVTCLGVSSLQSVRNCQIKSLKLHAHIPSTGLKSADFQTNPMADIAGYADTGFWMAASMMEIL